MNIFIVIPLLASGFSVLVVAWIVTEVMLINHLLKKYDKLQSDIPAMGYPELLNFKCYDPVYSLQVIGLVYSEHTSLLNELHDSCIPIIFGYQLNQYHNKYKPVMEIFNDIETRSNNLKNEYALRGGWSKN